MAVTARLLAQRRIHLPTDRLGMHIRFADGTSSAVYRETVVEGAETSDACALVVQFRLRFVRRGWHGAFRRESLLNTPLFVGFPGFVSKLWLAHDQRDVYRGIYDWNGADRAERYARSLWRVLELGCVPGSIRYRVVPGVRRDQLLAQPGLIDATGTDGAGGWWRPVSTA